MRNRLPCESVDQFQHGGYIPPEKRGMKTFEVRWEVLKKARHIKAKTEAEAIEKVMNSEVAEEEVEITTPCMAFEEN